MMRSPIRWAACVIAVCFVVATAASAAPRSAQEELHDCVVLPTAQKQAAGPAPQVLSSTDLGNVTVMALDGAYARGDSRGPALVAQRFYADHADIYDFLIVFTTFEFETGGALAYYNGIRNDVAGIGSPLYDYSTEFGSAGRLQGYVDMAAMSRTTFAPTDPRYGEGLDTIAHELMHRWVAKVSYRNAAGGDDRGLIGRDGGHWSYFLDSDASVMYGSDWRGRADGRFEAVAARERFSQLDLYLAGLVAPGEVAPMTLIRNGEGAATDLPRLGAVTGGDAETVTIEQIVAANGERVPSAAQAQKDFNAALILLTRPGERVEPARIANLETFRLRAQQLFAQMTDGRAGLRIYTSPKRRAVAPPQILQGSGAAPAPPGVAAAIVWLESRQAADGHWEDRPSTALRDTAAALRALEELSPASAAIAPARAWIASRTVANLDQHASRLIATRDAAQRAVFADVRNADGGWGLVPGFASSPLDTATVGDALALTAPDAAVDDPALSHLMPRQNADGSFGATSPGRGRLLPTMRAARLLQASAVPSALDAARRAGAWLDTRQLDIGFGHELSESLPDTIELYGLLGQVPLSGRGAEGARVFVRRNQQVAGDWGGSVYLTATAALATARDQRVNLAVVDAPAASLAAPYEGLRVQLSGAVVNSGHFASPPSVARWYDGDPAAGGVPTGNDIAVPALPPGARQLVAGSWDTRGRIGAHDIWLVADAADAIAESREDDNRKHVAIVIAQAPAGADLQLVDSELTLDPVAVDGLPANVRLTGIVRNIGRTDVAAAQLRLYAMADPGRVLAQAVVDVPARGSTPVDLAFIVADARSRVLELVADPDRAVAEANEDNNTARLTLAMGASLDLSVTPGEVALDGAAVAGRDVTFVVTVRNAGTVDAPPAQVRAEVVQGGISQAVFDNPVAVAAGVAVQRRFTWRAGGVGPAQLRVAVDPAGQVAEAREDNNSAQIDFEVVAADRPDLAVVAAAVAFMPSPALQGGPAQVSLRVRNHGAEVMSPFAVAVYADDPRSGLPPVGRTTLAGLGAGAETIVAVQIADLAVYGDHDFYVVADADSAVAELDETNNLAVHREHVTSLPDLVISVAGITLTPTLPVRGEALGARVSVRNVGEREARNVVVRFAEGDEGGATTVGERIIALLGAGAESDVTFDWTLGTRTDLRAIVVDVDPAGALREIRDDNNRAVLPFDVQDGPLFASERYISPNGDGVRDATAIVLRLGAAQPVELRIINARNLVARRFAAIELDASARGQAIWDGRDDRGRIVPDGDYRVQVLGEGGVALGETPVTVDNDRSSVLDAIGTPYAIETPRDSLTGIVQPPAGSAQHNLVFGLKSNSVADSSGTHWFLGLYRAHPLLLPSVEPVVSSYAAANLGGSVKRFVFDPDGRTIAITVASDKHSFSRVYLASPAGFDTVTPLLPAADKVNRRVLGFFDANELLVSRGNTHETDIVDLRTRAVRPFRSLPTNGDDVEVTRYGVFVREADGTRYAYFVPRDPSRDKVPLDAEAPDGTTIEPLPSPDRSRVLLYIRSERQERLELVDLAGGSRRVLVDRPGASASFVSMFSTEPGIAYTRDLTFEWIERLGEFVVADGHERELVHYDNNGNRLARITLPPVERAGDYEEWMSGAFIAAFRSVVSFRPQHDCVPMPRSIAGGLRIYDPLAETVGLRLTETLATQYAPSLTALASRKAAARETGAASAAYLDGISQFVTAGLTTETVESTGSYSLTALTLPVDQARYPFVTDVCPADLPVLILRDGAALLNDGRIRSASHGTAAVPWRKANVIEAIWPNENALLTHDSVVTSMLNGYAMINAANRGDTIVLSGVAADRDFAYYEIHYEYAGEPGVWNPVTPPVADEVLLDEFLRWGAPQPGLYTLRLRVVDKAGNVSVATATANTVRAASIGNFALSPRYFSPNGDGVQDRIDVAFRVRRPATLTLTVHDDKGVPVTSSEHSYGASDVGTTQHLSWDGRGSGTTLPDGRYRISLDAFSAVVALDTAVPAVQAQLDDAYRLKTGNFVNNQEPVMVVDFADASPAGYRIDAQTTNGSSTELASVPHANGEYRHAVPFPVYAVSSFRLVASDAAGNETVQEMQKPRRIVVYEAVPYEKGYPIPAPFQPLPLADDASTLASSAILLKEGAAHLRGNLAMPARFVAVQAAPVDAPSDWREIASHSLAEVACAGTGACEPSRLDVPIPAGSLIRGKDYRLRLIGQDADGTRIASNHIRARVGGVVVSCRSPVGPPLQAVNYNLGALRKATFDLRARSGALLASVTADVSDATRATAQLPDGLTEDFRVIEIRAIDADGREHSDEKSCAVGGGGSGTGGNVPGEGERFEIEVHPVVEDRCDGEPSHALDVVATVRELARASRRSRVWRLVYVDGAALQETATAAQPVSDQSVFRIGTRGWPAGGYRAVLQVSDEDGAAAVWTDVAQGILPVVTLPPAVSITAPRSGMQLCAADLETAVHGIVTNAGKAGYRVSLGAGAVPASWIPVHDTNFLVGPSSQSGQPRPVVFEEIGGFVGNSTRLDEPLLDVHRYDPVLMDPEVNYSVASGFQRFQIVNGAASLRLQAVNFSGGPVCATATFHLDGGVEWEQREPARQYAGTGSRRALAIAPNGNPLYAQSRVALLLGEPLTLVSRLHRQKAGDPAEPGELVAEISRTEHSPGGVDLGWDGRISGTLVNDGSYIYIVEARDDCGNIDSLSIPLVIKATPPKVVITAPETDATIAAAVVGIRGIADDPYLFDWKLEALTSASLNPLDLAGGSRSMRDFDGGATALAAWSRGRLTGKVTLRLTAADLFGNRASVEVPFVLDAPAKLIDSTSAVPVLFSPNADGVLDTTRLQVALLRTAEVVIGIRDAAGQGVATLHQGTVGDGVRGYVWSGRRGDAPLPDGEYAVVIDAADPVGMLSAEQALLQLEIDTTPPAITLTSPASTFMRKGSLLGFRIDERHPAEYSAILSRNDAVVATVHGATEPTNGIVLSPELAEGTYRLVVTALDAAGNRSERTFDLALDATPPVVEILAPADPAFVPALKPTPVTGSVHDDNLATYTLAVAPADSEAWTTLATGKSTVDAATLSNWTPNLPDGRYRLRLSATDRAGNSAQVLRDVVVDGTPPVADIATPADGAFVKPAFATTGVAMDTNFAGYRLSLRRTGDAPDAWSDVHVGEAPVAAAKLADLALPPLDGDWLLRLTVTDRVGNTASDQAALRLDATPPNAPLDLIGRVENGRNAILDWNAVAAADLAGYHVWRGGLRITAAPIGALRYVDVDVPEGVQQYHVTAVDAAGNESKASNRLALTFDRTPPMVAIVRPADGERVRGTVTIDGTAFSASDFESYRVTAQPVAPAGAAATLAESTLPVDHGRLADVDTRAFAQETRLRLQLEARDRNGNAAAMHVDVIVDNAPPAAPTGLVAAFAGTAGATCAPLSGVAGDVRTCWNPNTETDLLGYLLYRDGRLVGGPELLLADLWPFAVRTPALLDLDVADGVHRYVVYAIDLAGNVSAPSEPTDLAPIESGPPDLAITQPQNDTAFERQIAVVATSEHLDIAEVQFAWRSPGGAWANLGATLTERPYRVVWAPSALPYGTYEIRAIARDTAGNVDPTPPVVRVRYADLTPPDAPTLRATADSTTVEASWTASSAADIAGYEISRLDGSGWQPLSTALLTGTAYDDADRYDRAWEYRVVAVDRSGNRSAPSNIAVAQVFGLDLEQPYTPTAADTTPLRGRSPLPGTFSIQVENAGVGVDVPAVTVAGDGVVAQLPLRIGENRIKARLTDTQGNRSRPASLWVVRGAAPTAPTGLAAQVQERTVHLVWNANPEADIAGYRVLRGGNAQPVERALAEPVLVQSDYGNASMAVDGDVATCWQVEAYLRESGPRESDPALTLVLPAQRLVSGVRLSWVAGHAARAIDLQAWTGHAWLTVAQSRDATATEQMLTPAQAYPAIRLRIVVRATVTGNVDYRLAEATVVERPLIEATQLEEMLAGGRYDYRVSAVSSLGFEGPPSDRVEVTVGNATAPEPVVLEGVLEGRDGHLAWTASATPDVARYELHRDGKPVANVAANAPRAWTDAGLANGRHDYIVIAYDSYDGASAPSNTVSLTVNGEAPGVPAPSVTAPPQGGMLDVAWTPGAGSTPANYVLRRSSDRAGPFVEIARVFATAYHDEPLTNGVRYWYTVEAIDAFGNTSGPSAPVVGMPRRDAAVAMPVFTWPTTAAAPLATHLDETIVCGRADPGSSIDIERDGVLVGNSSASATTLENPYFESYVPPNALPAPDGGHAAFERGDGTIELAAPRTFSTRVVATTGRRAQWAQRGLALYWQDLATGSIERLEPGREPTSLGIAIADLRAYAISADETRVLFVGSVGASAAGVWLAGVDGRDARRIEGVDAASLVAPVLSYAPDGRHALVLDAGDAHLVDLRSAKRIAGFPIDATTRPSWSQDSRLVYVIGGEARIRNAAAGESVLATGVRDAAWSPDGGQIALLRDGAVELVDALDRSAAAPAIPLGSPDARLVAWTAAGSLVLETPWGEVRRVDLSGRFCSEAVALTAAKHVFGGSAQLDGNRSLPAATILLTRPASTLPDLAVGASDVLFLPAIAEPRARVDALVTVRNRGLAKAPASVLHTELIPPDGSAGVAIGPAEVAALDAGAAQAVVLNLGMLPDAGRYRLRVTVDAENAIVEADEANNAAEAFLAVAAAGEPLLELHADRLLFAPGEPVTGEVAISNLDRPARVRVAAVDAAGTVVDEIGTFDVAPTAGNARWSRAVSWAAEGVIAGDYRLRARLVDTAGATRAERHAPVTIEAVRRVTLRLEPESSTVAAGEAMSVRSVVTFDEGNAPVAGSRLQLVAVASDGRAHPIFEQTLGTLMPGYELRRTDLWNTQEREEGAYLLQLRLVSPEIDQVAEAAATIIAPQAEVVLGGTLELEPSASLVAGLDSELAYTVTNAGTTTLAGVDLRVRVVTADGGTLVAVREQTVALDAQAHHTAVLPLSSPPLAFVLHAVTLEARLPGDPPQAWRLLARRTFEVIDALPPQIVVAAPSPQLLHPAVVPLRASITDAHSTIAVAQVSVDGGAWQPLTVGLDGWYARGLAGLADGDHTLVVRASDAWGNEAITAPHPFAVDATPPLVSVDGVADGELAARVVVPVVGILEANPGETDIRLNGVTYVSGTPVADDGDYLLSVHATDRAGNEARHAVHFRVDRTAPPAAIIAPADHAVVATSAVDVVVATEAAASVTLAVGGWHGTAVADAEGRAAFESVPLALGANRIEARATDAAGNTGGPAAISVTFATDPGRGLVGTVQPGFERLPYGEALPVALRLENTNAFPLAAQRLRVQVIAGAVLAEQVLTRDFAAQEVTSIDLAFADAGWPLGPAEVTLSYERNGAWTELDRAAIDVVDVTPPVFAGLAPRQGAIVRSPVALVAQAADALSGIASVEARVDDAASSPLTATSVAGEFAAAPTPLGDGEHRWSLHATDGAGNAAQAGPIAFAVDNTPPAIHIGGVADGDLLARPVSPTVTVDELHPSTQSITLNGAPYVPGTAIATSGRYVLAVSATDLAGNAAQASVAFTLDFDAPAVTLTYPANGAIVSSAAVIVTGATEPGARVDVTAGTFAASMFAGTDGAFSVVGATLQPGANTITARATDAVGNVGPVASVNVVYQPAQTTPLTGSIGKLPLHHPDNKPLAVPRKLTNPGATQAVNVPVRVVLRTAPGVVPARQHAFTASLAAGASLSGVSTLQTLGLSSGMYDVDLEAWQPNAQGTSAWRVLDSKKVYIAKGCGCGGSLWRNGFEQAVEPVEAGSADAPAPDRPARDVPAADISRRGRRPVGVPQ